ncbi:hypothetical protein PM082_016188 [Marasmius tenuissimus]|nr:hypothetical protein PM082_016188 [Marasmius tenuissimus]
MITGLISFVEAIKMASLRQFLKEWIWSILATIVTGVVNDVLIASSLTWILIRRRDATTSKDTIAVIDKLILWTLLTFNTRNWALDEYGRSRHDDSGEWLTVDGDILWLYVFALLAKLYSNSLMAVLNDRDTLREKMGTLVEAYPPGLGPSETPLVKFPVILPTRQAHTLVFSFC